MRRFFVRCVGAARQKAQEAFVDSEHFFTQQTPLLIEKDENFDFSESP